MYSKPRKKVHGGLYEYQTLSFLHCSQRPYLFFFSARPFQATFHYMIVLSYNGHLNLCALNIKAEVVDGLVADGEKYAGRDISKAGTSIRTNLEKMLKRTWQKESIGTEWYPPSPPRAGLPSLPRGLLPWTEQSGVWRVGQGKPGRTKRFVWSLACTGILQKKS